MNTAQLDVENTAEATVVPSPRVATAGDAPEGTALGPGTDARSDVSADESPRREILSPQQPVPPRARRLVRWIISSLRGLATLAILLIAVLIGLVTWDYYVTAPWTRDGRIRVQVASVAPQVSGQIIALHVADNQFVHKGDVLYVIDPFDFQVALRTDTATMQQRAADVQVKQVQSQRRQSLSSFATTPEEQQVYAGAAVQAKAAFEAAQEQVAQAEINLKRTEVRSPVNGYVTNLLMRVGDYAHQGVSNVSVIDADSYWIDGYFEETKMARICAGVRAEAKLMGYAQPIVGHVATVTRGIGVSDATAGAQGLPNVDPVYTWVRLAQRLPVRIAIDKVPRGVPLVSGMTATVTVHDAPNLERHSWADRIIASVKDRLTDVVQSPQARPGCIPLFAGDRDLEEQLPVEKEEAGPSPEAINPGLAPGIGLSPQLRER